MFLIEVSLLLKILIYSGICLLPVVFDFYCDFKSSFYNKSPVSVNYSLKILEHLRLIAAVYITLPFQGVRKVWMKPSAVLWQNYYSWRRL